MRDSRDDAPLVNLVYRAEFTHTAILPSELLYGGVMLASVRRLPKAASDHLNISMVYVF